jgi:hypothetical protein
MKVTLSPSATAASSSPLHEWQEMAAVKLSQQANALLSPSPHHQAYHNSQSVSLTSTSTPGRLQQHKEANEDILMFSNSQAYPGTSS